MANAGTRKGCTFAWTLLQRLREAVDALELNTDVGDAKEGDELAGYNREMAISTYGTVANEEIWVVRVAHFESQNVWQIYELCNIMRLVYNLISLMYTCGICSFTYMI